MASDHVGCRPSHFMCIPNTKRHPNNTKTDQLPIFGVNIGIPRPYLNTLLLGATSWIQRQQALCLRAFVLWRSRVGKRNLAGMIAMTIRKTSPLAFAENGKQIIGMFNHFPDFFGNFDSP